MTLTDRYTRLLFGTLTLGALLVPATVAGADPIDDEKAPPPPTTECPEPLATCEICLPGDPCFPVEKNPDCPDFPADQECPEVYCIIDDPECPPEETEDPDPETPVDEPVPADPNFTG